MKNRLIIISAGDYGREVAWLARSIPPERRDWEFAGFLDDRLSILDPYPGEGPILGSVESYQISEADRFVCAVGYANQRMKYIKALESRGAVFANVIHPTALIGVRCKLGHGIVIWNGATITTDIFIGNHSNIMSNVVIGHNVKVGVSCMISAFCFIGGHAQIGDEVFLAPHSCLVPRKKIGNRSTLGIGSVALRNLKNEVTAFGIPACEI